MKTIYSTILKYIYAYDVTAETELSLIGTNQTGGSFEILFAKKDENKTWFWSEKEAQTHIDKQQSIKDELEALRLKLEFENA